MSQCGYKALRTIVFPYLVRSLYIGTMWSGFFAVVVTIALSISVPGITAGPVRGAYPYAPQYRRTYAQEVRPYGADAPEDLCPGCSKSYWNSQSLGERQWKEFPDKLGSEAKPWSSNPFLANYPAHYLEEPRIQAGYPTWPDGMYALPKPLIGCPFNPITPAFQWSQGWILQDTENYVNNYQSPSGKKNLDVYDAVDLIVTQFCTKDSTAGDSGTKWPPGSYCIARYGPCPDGFQDGSVFWDDENSDNRNTRGGALPDGQFDTDTRLDYCCRNDAAITQTITLPYAAPFYLMCQSVRGCQRVRYMNVIQETLLWDDENTNNQDSESGLHPYDSGDPQNHKLNYCYYTPKYIEY